MKSGEPRREGSAFDDRTAAGYAPRTMPLKAHVKNGRLVLDEPTELPEGTEVTLTSADEDRDDEDRARLHAALERSMAQAKAGKLVDADDVIARLLARRANERPPHVRGEAQAEACDAWWRENRDVRDLFARELRDTHRPRHLGRVQAKPAGRGHLSYC